MLHLAPTLDASITVEDALEALKPYPESSFVIIRRREGVEIYWYFFPVYRIRQLPADLGAEALGFTLQRALDLHEWGASDTRQVDDYSAAELESAYGVLLDGDRAMGVLEPPPSQAAVSRGGDDVPPALSPSPFGYGYVEPAPPAAPGGSEFPDLPVSAGPGDALVTIPVRAYPRLDAPDSVASEAAVDLLVGLSREQLPGVAGGAMTVPTADEEFDLTVQVIAQGFQLPNGLRHNLHVNRHRVEDAEIYITLIAPQIDEGVYVSALEVEFSFLGNLIGRAWREIRVVPQGADLIVGDINAGSTPLPSTALEATPNLTISITASDDERSLEWTFTTPHPIDLPNDHVTTTFKQDNAETFAYNQVKTVAEADNTLFINEKVMGIARNIADQIPWDAWEVIEKVWRLASGAGRVPSVLLVSSEPYIPWELASTESDYLDPSLVDAARPPLLGAQLRLGRWLPEGPRNRRGLGYPRIPPSAKLPISTMALVVEDYAATMDQRPLPKAKEEGTALSNRYRSVWLRATEYELNQLLQNQLEERGTRVDVEAIHFACHGEVSQNPRFNGIVLSDKSLRLEPIMFRGSKICPESQPFIFMNACQLGLASEGLGGDYGGLAGACLRSGCSGFIAPLWSVNDQVAHDLALEFYEKALDSGEEVSEVLRNLRSGFDMSAQKPPSTWIAYVYYGHPNLVLTKVP